MRCTGATACRERLTLRLRGGRLLARTELSLKAGQARTVRLTLKRADRRKRAQKLTVTLGGRSYERTLRVS